MRAVAQLCAAVLVSIIATWSAAQELPGYENTYINDFAGVLTASERSELLQILEEVREERGIEMVVVTIDGMADYGHTGVIDSFATRLFNMWGVGDATRNDGVMILVARSDRVMRIELGAGYDRSLDRAMQRVIDTQMLPAFRDARYGQGLLDGTRHTIWQLTDVWPGEFHNGGFRRAVSNTLRTLGLWLIPLLSPVAGIMFLVYRRWQRNRPRICPNDGSRMERQSEYHDDLFLEAGQEVEERIGSMNYDVWTCNDCDHYTIEAYPKSLRRYGACGSCGYRTTESDTITLRAATTVSGGLQRQTVNCKHCGHSHTREIATPMIVQDTLGHSSGSSGFSSSSGSSFGGGSSRGGGASGSW